MPHAPLWSERRRDEQTWSGSGSIYPFSTLVPFVMPKMSSPPGLSFGGGCSRRWRTQPLWSLGSRGCSICSIDDSCEQIRDSERSPIHCRGGHGEGAEIGRGGGGLR